MKSPLWKLLFCAGLLLRSASTLFAQGEIASGTISASGDGPFDYSLSFSNAADATSPIGSIWYAWVPGAFYLPGSPKTPTTPPGWTANVSGHSIQFVANSAANDIAPGSTLSGFGYQATFSPAQLAAALNSGVSVAYSGQLFADSGYTFTVKALAVPEPTSAVLLLSGAAVLFLLRQRMRPDQRP